MTGGVARFLVSCVVADRASLRPRFQPVPSRLRLGVVCCSFLERAFAGTVGGLGAVLGLGDRCREGVSDRICDANQRLFQSRMPGHT